MKQRDDEVGSTNETTHSCPTDTVSKFTCPADCVNQRQDGITLAFFGNRIYHLDKFEILIHLLIIILPVNISLRDAWNGNLSFKESMERIAMISVLVGFVRMSPTEQISNLLSSINLVKK